MVKIAVERAQLAALPSGQTLLFLSHSNVDGFPARKVLLHSSLLGHA